MEPKAVSGQPHLRRSRDVGAILYILNNTPRAWRLSLDHLSSPSPSQVADPAAAATPWLPAGCGCVPVREPFGARSYGGYRPLHWWLASFLRPFANGSAAMPTALHWPAMAQFAMPRAAIRGR